MQGSDVVIDVGAGRRTADGDYGCAKGSKQGGGDAVGCAVGAVEDYGVVGEIEGMAVAGEGGVEGL